jgi:hypothetical protein
MGGDELAAAVDDALDVDASTFQSQVRDDTETIKRELAAGTFDNPQAIVGLEYEFYAVDDETTALERVPRRLLEFIGFEKELGLHNAEMCTSPQPFNAHGLRAQEAEVLARLQTAQECAAAETMRLVSDGLWTIAPAGESAAGYLTDSVTDRGVRLATNMSSSARYHAMANATDVDATAGMRLDAPHVNLLADTVMPESLITSIQPHYQVPHADDLPQYFQYALRIAGPLLAVAVNSPFFPPDLYDDAPPDRILDDAWMAHRISVFETVLNAETDTTGKARFPRDLDSVETAVDRIAADDTLVPMLVEDSNRFDDQFGAFRMKHGTYWRWVRPVFDGATRSSANARIEFRPIAGQPTVRDAIAFQAVFAGLMEALPKLEHPVVDLDWAVARDNFYRAMRNGLDADLVWITNDGQHTRTLERCYEDLFAHAEEGLKQRGLDGDEAARYTHPLRARVRHDVTPASWKRDHVRGELDAGGTLADAIESMQRAYVDAQRETLLSGSFADWLQRD